MSYREPKFGFWIPVTDMDSAKYAAKMSGLPVFLLGLSFIGTALLLALQPNIMGAVFNLFAAIFFIVAGLRIRSGRHGLLPIAVGLWLGLTLWGLVNMWTAPSVLNSTGVAVSTVINGLIGLLAVSGLRGWWWLRQNPAA